MTLLDSSETVTANLSFSTVNSRLAASELDRSALADVEAC